MVFPNPVGDCLQLHFREKGFYDVSIYNLTGMTVYQGRVLDGARIDVSHLSQGTYVVRCRRVRDGQVVEERFIR